MNHVIEWLALPQQVRKELKLEYDELLARYKNLQKLISECKSSTKCFHAKEFSIKKFKWAYWIVRSRWVWCSDPEKAAFYNSQGSSIHTTGHVPGHI